MNARQLHAITHPLTTPDDSLDRLRTIRLVDRRLLVVVLAVDR